MTKLKEKARRRNQAMFMLAGIKANILKIGNNYDDVLSTHERESIFRIAVKLTSIRDNKDNAWKIVKKKLGLE